jgi:hypothetical protein
MTARSALKSSHLPVPHPTSAISRIPRIAVATLSSARPVVKGVQAVRAGAGNGAYRKAGNPQVARVPGPARDPSGASKQAARRQQHHSRKLAAATTGQQVADRILRI